MTGQTVYTGIEVASKRLEFLRQIVPAAKRLSWIAGADILSVETLAGGHFDAASVFESAAKGLGFETRFHAISAPKDIDAVFGDFTAWGAERGHAR